MTPQPTLFDIRYARDRGAIAWHGLPQEVTETQVDYIKRILTEYPLLTISEIKVLTGYEKSTLSRILATMHNGKRVFDDTQGKLCPISGINVTAWRVAK